MLLQLSLVNTFLILDTFVRLSLRSAATFFTIRSSANKKQCLLQLPVALLFSLERATIRTAGGEVVVEQTRTTWKV
jgi:hypothetical protein